MTQHRLKPKGERSERRAAEHETSERQAKSKRETSERPTRRRRDGKNGRENKGRGRGRIEKSKRPIGVPLIFNSIFLIFLKQKPNNT